MAKESASELAVAASDKPSDKPNELYYFRFAPGTWIGELEFEVFDWAACLREVQGLERLVAVGLWVAGRSGKLVITATMTPRPLERLAANDTVIRWNSFVVLGPQRLWRAVGRFALDDNGHDVTITMRDEYGPLSGVITVRTSGAASVREDGASAAYELTVFGRRWAGEYRFNDERNEITAEYRPLGTKQWGRIRYRATRAIPVEPPAKSPRQAELVDLAKRLGRLGDELRRRGHLLSVFCDLYSDETLMIADALAEFHDPEWTADIALAFGQRFFSAWSDHESGRAIRSTWRPVFDALERRAMTELDALAICICAHIVGDMPRVLSAVNGGKGLGEKADDFHRVNLLLKRTLDTLQDNLADRYGVFYRLLDELAGNLDETFVASEVAGLRTTAWYDAFRLLSSDVSVRHATEHELDERVMLFVDQVLDPRPRPVAVLAGLVRRLIRRGRLLGG